MRLMAALGALLFALWSSVSQGAEPIRLRVVEFAPNYFQQDGRWQGLDVELAEAVIKEAGFTVQFVDLPWSRALAYMQSGGLDMMANLSRTPDREAFMHFIGPERLSKRVLVVRKEHVGLAIAGLDDLVAATRHTRRRIGIQNNAKYSAAFDARLETDTEFASAFEAVSVGAVLPKKVSAGRNLGFFEDENYVVHQLKHSPDFESLAVHAFTLATDPVYLGISKRMDAAAVGKLEAALQRLEKNGTLAKIRSRWSRADK